jgi:hypothetical protein
MVYSQGESPLGDGTGVLGPDAGNSIDMFKNFLGRQNVEE